jgi:hypothetical protein
MRSVNRWAVPAAVLITLLASFIWYAVFGRAYIELRGVDPDDTAATAMHPWPVRTPALLAAGR